MILIFVIATSLRAMVDWELLKMAMQFAIRIEGWQFRNHPNAEDIKFEEWDTLKLAEQRATTLRKQGARVEIYRLL